MPSTFIIFYFLYAMYWGTLFHLIVNIAKVSKPIFSGIMILLLFSLIPDTVNLYNVLNLIPSQIPSQTYATFLPIGIFYLYFRNNIISSPPPLVIILFLFHFALAIITIFRMVDLGEFEGMLNFSANIFATSFSIYHFYKLFKSLEVPNLLNNSLFWISTAIFCYNAGTIFLQVLQPVFTELGYFHALWPFYQIILIAYIVILNYAIRVELKYG